MSNIEIIQTSWSEMEKELRDIRACVFIEEQNVPEELEWEDDDLKAIHLLVKKNGSYVATSRLLASGQIGRMAVLKPYRNTGVGSEMLENILNIAKSMSMHEVFLNAQVDAIGFYKKFGFQEQCQIFDDAGIPHKKMVKALNLAIST